MRRRNGTASPISNASYVAMDGCAVLDEYKTVRAQIGDGSAVA